MPEVDVLRTPRDDVRLALAGRWPGRILRGELVIDDGFVRDMVGIAGEAVPWSARQAVVASAAPRSGGGAFFRRLGQPGAA